MKIAIDGTTLRAHDGGPGAGVEEYTRRVTAALVGAAEGLDRVRVSIVKPIGRVPLVSRHLSVPLQAAIARADVLLCPSGHIPLGWFGRAVIVVHDLAIHEHPEWFPSQASWQDARSIRRAEKIIAVSEATRQQIGRLFPDALEKTVVVYPGGGEANGSQGSRVPGSQDIILFVGTIEPRKNLVNAMAAFDAFLRAHPERATLTRFMLAGRVGWKAEPVLEAVGQTNDAWRKRADGEDVIRLLGYVTEDEKQSLYRQASCLFFPSWYEGFGLPALEAMAVGCPVITSSRGALPEVCGDAAMYVEPDDIEQMAFTLAQCVMLPEAMGEMVEQAKNRASQFTWLRAAGEILRIVASSAVAQ